jgi:hypothetical protein
MRWQRAGVVCGAFAVVFGAILMACTDGVTPDCSDAATQCGPDIDGAASTDTSVVLPDASKPDTAADAQSDADADLDAGNEN